MRPFVPFLVPTRLVAKARKLMTIPSTAGSSPTRKPHQYDNQWQTELPSIVTHNSNTQGEFKEPGSWDGTCQDQRMEETRTGREDVERPHKESYKDEVTERVDWVNGGSSTILVTRTTLVTIDTLGSFDRPWEYLGPSIGSPTIGRG